MSDLLDLAEPGPPVENTEVGTIDQVGGMLMIVDLGCVMYVIYIHTHTHIYIIYHRLVCYKGK